MRKPFFFVFFFFFLMFSNLSFSQQHEGDTALIQVKDFSIHEFDSREVHYGFKKNFFTLNPFYHIFSSAMYIYQDVISQELMRSCVFEPSCSEYSKELIKNYGLTKGIIFTADRMTRCTRIALSGKEDLRFDASRGKIIEDVHRYGNKATKPLVNDRQEFVFDTQEAINTKHKWAKEDFEFIQYLLGNEMKDDAMTLMERNTEYIQDSSTQDSANYMKGWTYYSNKSLDNATYYFDQVSRSSEFYPKSVFFSALSSMHNDDYLQAQKRLLSFEDSTSYGEVYAFQRAGLALLQRDYKVYEYYSSAFTYSDYTITEQEQTLAKIYSDLKGYKYKKPWLAASLSAIVPGLGKVYAGKLGEGASSFLLVGSLGVITAENWIKNGLLNWKTLLFGLTGVTFYIGNIYGSITTTNIANADFNQRTNIAVLYSIHIPLRSIFE